MGRGGPHADMGTLLIVHFKVIVFLHWCFFLSQSPQYFRRMPHNQHDLKMEFTLVLEELSNNRDNTHLVFCPE